MAISPLQCHRECLLAAVSTATTETVGLTGDGNDSSCERTSVVALVIAITFQHCKNGKKEVNSNSRGTYSLRHRKCGVRGYMHELFVSKTRTSEVRASEGF